MKVKNVSNRKITFRIKFSLFIVFNKFKNFITYQKGCGHFILSTKFIFIHMFCSTLGELNIIII